MLALMFALLLSDSGVPARVQTDEMPAACRRDANGAVDPQACADAAPVGSPVRGLALINLARNAYIEGDYATALRLYDEAQPPGQTMASDVLFHTFRADTYAHAGRDGPALVEAGTAWRRLNGEPATGNPADDLVVTDPLRFEVLLRILPILKMGDAAVFNDAKTMFLGLPAADPEALTNRAAVLSEIGMTDQAVQDSARALAMAPDHPVLLNNHCSILNDTGRSQEALAYCERAVAGMPNIGAIRHSYATALANTGQCEGARREIAEARRLDPSRALYAEPLTCTPAGR